MRRTEKYRGYVVPVDWFGNASYQVEFKFDTSQITTLDERFGKCPYAPALQKSI